MQYNDEFISYWNSSSGVQSLYYVVEKERRKIYRTIRLVNDVIIGIWRMLCPPHLATCIIDERKINVFFVFLINVRHVYVINFSKPRIP